MKAHALSLSLLLAVLPALSHPVAIPAADAQRSQESWQLPWSDGSGPVHAYRGPVREEYLQCDQGQCPLPAHEGGAPASGPSEGLSPEVEPAAPARQDAPVAQGKAGKKADLPVAKGQEIHSEQEIPSREKRPSSTAAITSPAAGKGMTAPSQEAPSAQAPSGDPKKKQSAAASRPAANKASGPSSAQQLDGAAQGAAPAPGANSPSDGATAETSVPVTDEKAAYQAGLDLILSGRLDEGMARMQALLDQHPSGAYAANAESPWGKGRPGDQHPSGAYAANAEYWLGEALSSQGRNEEALKHFRNVEARYPKHHKNADALLRTGMILRQQGDAAGAGKAFRQVVQRFPASAAAGIIRKKGLVQP